MTRPETIERFQKNSSGLAAVTFRVRSAEELNEVLWEVLDGSTAGEFTIYCPRSTDKENMVRIPPALVAPSYETAGVCVEEVSGAIAETGSVVCSSAGGRAVQAGLLPSHHVAIVDAENIFETLDDYFAGCPRPLPTNITFESGPSRTADIELTLTIGVHGPERLTIIVFG